MEEKKKTQSCCIYPFKNWMNKRDKIIGILEELLQESEERFSNVLGIFHDVIYQIDCKTGMFDYVAPSSRKVLGYSPEEIMNSGLSKIVLLIHPDDRKRMTPNFYRLTGDSPEKSKVFCNEYRFKHKELGYRWINDNCSIGFNEKNIPTAIVGIMRDITENKQMEDQMLKLYGAGQDEKHRRVKSGPMKKLQISEKNLKMFSKRLLLVREEEKKKIAIDLHDSVSSMVVDLSSKLSIAEENIKNNDIEGTQSNIKEAREAFNNAVRKLKGIATGLRPPHLDIIGLPDVLKNYFSDISQQTKLEINYHIDIGNRKLMEDVAITLYRVVQETFNNIIEHAKAKKVNINLFFQYNKLNFIISDDGNGFKMVSLRPADGLKMGIWGMRERVEAIGGDFNIRSAPGKGTKIEITLENKLVY